jgi:8-oxo-dGTP pyrophosphatase MutT (NUDIX family)
MARLSLIPAAYIFLERDDGKFLLMLRARTGYEDGKYQTPSGHIEEGETPREAAAREALEEVGVTIRPEDLEPVHAMYRMHEDKTGYRMDLSFKTTKWEGEPYNAEPEKCDELIWVDPAALPENTTGVIRSIVKDMKEGRSFSEYVTS